MAGPIFSFGRDHGYFGRLLNQTVVSIPTLTVRDGHEITGFCFTPQDGNSLLSSVAAAAWLLDPHTYDERLDTLGRISSRKSERKPRPLDGEEGLAHRGVPRHS